MQFKDDLEKVQFRNVKQLADNYYQNQLDRLKKGGDFAMKVKFVDLEGKETHYLSLNKDSIPVIINYLNSLK